MIKKYFALFSILILLCSNIQFVAAEEPPEEIVSPSTVAVLSTVAQMKSVANQIYGLNIEELIDASNDLNDTDGDGIPDSVETIIGTDLNNSDSDFDDLDDLFELENNLDPIAPDSNRDGIADYFEVTDVDLDPDGDGFENQWDLDNDGDGVIDSIDLSPFSSTAASDKFTFNIKTSGKPTYIDFQIRPKDPNHLTLPTGGWDWPEDNGGSIRDLDNSEKDISVIPLLEFDADILPPRTYLSDYGITVDNGTAIIPLLPQQELGLTSAFKGKMFYPEGAPLDITSSAKLIWKININTDFSRDKIHLKSGTDFIVLNNETKELTTSPIATGCSEYTLVELGEDRISIRDCNGMFLSVEGNDIKANSSIIDYDQAFNVTDKGNNRIALKANNGKYLSLEAGILKANSDLEFVFTKEKTGTIIDTQTVTAVTYREDFMVTGMTVEENHGTDVGVFYKDNKDEVMKAGFVMAYGFLRNNQTSLTDMPDKFIDNNVSIIPKFKSFSHRDIALYTLATETTKEVLDELPDNEILPVIHAFEDNLAMEEIEGISGGNHFDFDLTGEDIVTTKSMKVDWYNTSDDSQLDSEGVIREIEKWGASKEQDALPTFAAIVLSWSYGETIVTKVGDDYTIFPNEGELDVLKDIKNYGFGSIRFAWKMVGDYRLAKWFLPSDIAHLVKQEGSFKSAIKTLGELNTGLKGVKGLKILNRVGKAIGIIGKLIDPAIAIWTWMAIADAQDWSSFGVALGFVTFLTILAYALYYIALAAIPVVGWVFALFAGIMDWLFGFGDTLISQIIEWITKVDQRSTVDLNFRESRMDITDFDGDGNDAGDQIDFIAQIDGVVELTSHGGYNDLTQSYIKPNFRLDEDSYHFGPWLYTRYFSNWSSYIYQTGPDNITSTKKVTPYESGISVTPRMGLVNLPVPILLASEYNIYYDECVWVFFDWVCSRDNEQNTSVSDLTTIYVDIMPDNIDDFMDGWWRYAQDMDGDGLSNGEDPNDWSWDMDGDGISDYYEKELGTDAGHADTDRDGLNDRMELYYGTDPLSWDTDGDRMEDFLEIQGWQISFNYSNQSFDMIVHSNPLEVDSDGDGIDDQMERWSFLNPMSWDTNGDGIKDEARPEYVTYIFFEDEWEGFNDLQGIDVDNRGFVYILEGGYYANGTVKKYDSSGNFLTNWSVDYCSSDISTDYDGNVFTLVGGDQSRYKIPPCPDPYILKHSTNGTLIDLFDLTYPTTYGGGIAVDTDGYIYVSNPFEYYIPNPKYPGFFIPIGCVHKYDSNGNGVLPRFCNETLYYANTLDTSKDFVYITGGGEGQIPVNKYYKNGTFVKIWGDYGSGAGNFSRPYGIATDPRGYVYVADTGNYRIQKFDPDGYFIARWGSQGSDNCPPAEPNCECTAGNCELNWPNGIAVDRDLYVYVTDSGNNRVTKYSQYTEVDYYDLNLTNVTDTDQDGLMDLAEETGWQITVTNQSTTYTTDVNSSYLMKDTDLDGLTDFEEFNLLSNPGKVDTDDDSLSDYVEFEIGTDINHYDTDGDSLSDSEEIAFGSSAFANDTDGEGLDDFKEFGFLSSPVLNDTDGDGLTDLEEYLMNTSLIKADSDEDGLTDAHEQFIGGDPNKGDSDGDNLTDGFEIFFNTNVTNGDTDDDGVPDGTEVKMHIDPLLNDTDGDGLPDGAEINNGTDPRDADTDDDGILDSDDQDSFGDQVGEIILSYDVEYPEFISSLEKYTNVTVVDPSDLDNHKDNEYILLVGKPLNTTVLGNIISELIPPESIETMMGDYPGLITRFGVWKPKQTVIILNVPDSSSHYDILNQFREMNVTKTENKLVIDYNVPRDSIRIDFIDAVMTTNSMVSANFNSNLTISLELTSFNESTTPYVLPGSIGQYLAIEGINDTDVNQSFIRMYYNTDEDENRLKMFAYDDGWKTLTYGINTTDAVVNGIQYDGYVYAQLSHLSLFSIGTYTQLDILNCTQSYGWWKHEYQKKGDKLERDDLEEMLNIINLYSDVFEDLTIRGAADILDKADKSKGKDNMRDLAMAKLLSAWLNYAAGAVDIETIFKNGMTFEQIINEAEEKLAQDQPHKEIVNVKNMLESVEQCIKQSDLKKSTASEFSAQFTNIMAKNEIILTNVIKKINKAIFKNANK